jgi:hypothetical protein
MQATFYYMDNHTSDTHDGSQNVVKIEWENGAVEHYQNGVLHKEDGPALIHANGSREYWINGQRRTREFGPSIEWADGTIDYVDLESPSE